MSWKSEVRRDILCSIYRGDINLNDIRREVDEIDEAVAAKEREQQRISEALAKKLQRREEQIAKDRRIAESFASSSKASSSTTPKEEDRTITAAKEREQQRISEALAKELQRREEQIAKDRRIAESFASSSKASSSTTPIEKGRDILAYHMLQLNRRIEKVPGDGNCQFHAVADQMSRLPDVEPWMTDHKELRARAVAYLARRDTPLWNRFSKIFEDDPRRRAYLEEMARDTEWGDNSTLVALACILNVHITVIKDAGNILEIECPGGTNPRGTIVIGHIAEKHYVSSTYRGPTCSKHPALTIPSETQDRPGEGDPPETQQDAQGAEACDRPGDGDPPNDEVIYREPYTDPRPEQASSSVTGLSPRTTQSQMTHSQPSSSVTGITISTDASADSDESEPSGLSRV